MTLDATISGIAVWGPGLEGWDASRPVLSGAAPYVPAPSPAPPPAILAPTERRRTGPVVRLALAVAHGAALSSGLPPSGLRCVFASSNGDGLVVGGILDALATSDPESRIVSPTQFHNSVHNAAAGYWTIGVGTSQPALCLGAFDESFAAGLLMALVDRASSGQPVLLCCYDHPMPAPLDAVRPTAAAFGVGLVLTAPGGAGPALSLSFRPGASTPPPLHDGALQALADGNAAARALPLLSALARGGAHRLALPYGDGVLDLAVRS